MHNHTPGSVAYWNHSVAQSLMMSLWIAAPLVGVIVDLEKDSNLEVLRNKLVSTPE